MNKNKIVVTGATGFIGSHLVRRLRQENIYLELFDRKKHSFEDETGLRTLVKDCKTIFHLAGVIITGDGNFDFNINSTKNLLKAVSKSAPRCQIIFSSSYSVYKTPDKGEVVDEKFPLKPRNAYGVSKLKCEELLRSYSKRGRAQILSLRLSNVYGPSDDPNSHSVISTFINKIIKGEHLVIDGDGSQERDFIYISDVVDVLILASKVKSQTYQVVNICSGESVSISGLVKIIEKVVGKKAKISYNRAPANNQGYWRSKNLLARNILGWKPKINLIEGIKLTFNKGNW